MIYLACGRSAVGLPFFGGRGGGTLYMYTDIMFAKLNGGYVFNRNMSERKE